MNAITRFRPVCRRELQGSLDRLGSAIGEKDPLLTRSGRQRGQALGQPDLRNIVEISPRHVDQEVRLAADRRDDLGMRVPDVGHRDPGGEVQVAVAVHVFDHRALARRTTSGYARVYEGDITRSSRLNQPARPRQRSNNPRFLAVQRSHPFSLPMSHS